MDCRTLTSDLPKSERHWLPRPCDRVSQPHAKTLGAIRPPKVAESWRLGRREATNRWRTLVTKSHTFKEGGHGSYLVQWQKTLRVATACVVRSEPDSRSASIDWMRAAPPAENVCGNRVGLSKKRFKDSDKQEPACGWYCRRTLA